MTDSRADPRAAMLLDTIQQHIKASDLVTNLDPSILHHVSMMLFEGILSGNQVLLNDLQPLLVSLSQLAIELKARHNASMSDDPNELPKFGTPSASGPAPWNAQLLETLKRQLHAYKQLQNNETIRYAPGTPSQQQQQQASPQNLKNENSNQFPQISHNHAAEQEAARKRAEKSDPYALLQQAMDVNTAQRIYIPSIMPLGIDPLELAQNREAGIENRIRARIAELQALPSNIGNDVKMQALIEMKGLLLLKRQKQLRSSVIAGVRNATMLSSTIGLRDHRRVRKPTLRDARVTERLEKQQKVDRERKAKQKHLEFLANIVDVANNMSVGRKALLQKQFQFGKSVLGWWTTAEREEIKRQDRNSKERLRALKADDEEAYLKLIDKEKDTRLAQLLGQTNAYLDELASLVKTQQADVEVSAAVASAQAAGVVGEPSGVANASSSVVAASYDDDEGDNKIDYYKVAHRITEEVTEQPSILVGGKLKEYQIKGLQWMVSLYNNRLNGILADEMGLGKTIQTIALITFLIEKKLQKGPYLVIVPLSTITNWTLEFERWAPAVATIVYKGTPGQRKALQMAVRAGNFNVLLTTYEYIIKDKAVLAKQKWVHMIIDEGHRMKNAHSKLTATLTQYYSTRYRLILTGTPLQNNLPELWAILNFVLPKIFNSVKNFEDWFNTPFASTGEKVELNEEESLLIIRRLHKVLRPFLLRRLKKDVESELPDKVELVLKCPMSPLQANLYAQIRDNGFLRVSGSKSGGKSTIQGYNNILMHLRKVCNHPFAFNEVIDAFGDYNVLRSTPILARTAGKFELLDRILPKLRAGGHKMLIFFQMTTIMQIMSDYLEWKGLVPHVNFFYLDGSTKADDRQEMLKSFNSDPNNYIFLLSTRAGGLGLNLQSADTVILYDSDWNPHQDLQAQDRAHRIGQTKEVRVLRLVTANSVEENILGTAQQKLDMDGKVIQAGKFDQKSTNEEREALLRACLDKNDEDDIITDIGDDDELNEIIARSDEELELFRRMDAERARRGDELGGVLFQSDPFGETACPARMITEDELPDTYLKMIAEPVTAEDDAMVYGRGGHRSGKDNKIYDDGMTEAQFLRMMEQQADEADADKLHRRRDRADTSSKPNNTADDTDGSSKGNAKLTLTLKKARNGETKIETVDSADDNDDDDDDDDDDDYEKSVKPVRGRKKRFRRTESDDDYIQ